tara:strand:- start:27 stop:617 length:591 start_codon:yes stop_codon:yes gene_type:complete
MGLKSFLFSKRSYTPIPIVISIVYFSDPFQPYFLIGLLFIGIGESIRFTAVRFAGGRTRTTKVGANKLCTSGPYAYTRNPLYIGNLLIYCGIVLFSGGTFLLELLVIVLIYFTFQYTLIISLEEDKLLELFGEQYLKYKLNVPRIIPQLFPWNNKKQSKPLTLVDTLKTEKRTLQNIILMILIIVTKSYLLINFIN